MGDEGADKRIQRGFHFICFGSFFIMLSLATHLPAYPHMLEEFNLPAGYAVWMQLGLAVGLTGFQPFLGWIGDTRGLKNVIIFGAISMIVGSLLVAFSPSFWVLIIGLFLKGVSGAAVAPVGVAYAGKCMVGERRGKAMGTFMAYSTIGALFGPLVSGMFVDYFDWQSVFIFTGVMGALAFLLFLVVPETAKAEKQKLDAAGLVLVILVILGVLTIPTFINSFGIRSTMWLPSLLVFLLSLFLLIQVERKQKNPLLDMHHAFKKSFWVPTLIATFIYIGYSGVMYLLTFFVQDVQEKPATLVGFLQMAIFAGTSLASLAGGRLLPKFSARTMIGSNTALFSAGVLMLIFVRADTSTLYMFISMTLIGIGTGFQIPAIKALVVSEAANKRISVAAFTNTVIENIAQRIGASFALVAFTLFSAAGGTVNAMSNASWVMLVFAILTVFLLIWIPKHIKGIHTDAEGETEETIPAARADTD